MKILVVINQVVGQCLSTKAMEQKPNNEIMDENPTFGNNEFIPFLNRNSKENETKFFHKLWLQVDQEVQSYMKNRKENQMFMCKDTTIRKQQLTEAVVMALFEMTSKNPSLPHFKYVLINAMIKNSEIEKEKRRYKKSNETKRANVEQDSMISETNFEELKKSLIVPRSDEDIPKKKYNNGKLGQALQRAYEHVLRASVEYSL